MDALINVNLLILFCEENSDATKYLVLRGNDLIQRMGRRIDDSDMMTICQFLIANDDIVKLELCYNEITDEGVQILIENYLSVENELEELNLMYNNITEDGVKLLCQNPYFKLKSLRLNGCPIGSNGGKYLSQLLTKNESLQLLDIAQSDQTTVTVAYLHWALNYSAGANSTLKILDISRIIPKFNRFAYDSSYIAETMGLLLQYNKTLVEIHLQKMQFDGHDIELLLIGLKHNTTLLFLDLGYNRIGDYGIEVLAKWLHNRPQLLGLNVAANSIKDTGARALSFHLPFSRIRLLDITHNKITEDGILDLLNSIKKSVMMRFLYMWGNKFTHITNKVILRMLMSGVLTQERLDVKIYEVDEVLYTAYYPSDRYKHKYYCEMDYACPVPFKTKHNKILPPIAMDNAKVAFKYHPRFPPDVQRKYKF